MGRALLFFFALALAVFWTRDFIAGGKLLAAADAHPDRKGTATSLFYLGRVYEVMNDDKNALSYYQRVADRYPRSRYGMEAQYGVASSLERMRLYPKALEEYNEFLAKYPKSPYDTSVRNNIEILKSR